MGNMNITTKSGKTINVDDESYVLDCGDGVIKHVFTDTSTYQSRVYTIYDDDIEVIDEKWTPERIDAIARMSGTTAPHDTADIAGYV
jgi:hypothetical protein